MTRTPKLFLAFALLTQAAFFWFVAYHRFIDADEGIYLLASRLVLAHKTPYLDFFYNQAPLLPYAYAAWMKCTRVSWDSGKFLSALLASLSGTVICAHVFRQTKSTLAAISAVVLFACNTLVFAWFTVVKTYALSGLLLFSAYAIISWQARPSSKWLILAGGVLFGLSVDTRSYVVLILPVFLWWITENAELHTGLRSSLWFLAGMGIGVMPSLMLFLSAPDAFLFDNLLYHGLRSSHGLIGGWTEKLVIVLQLFLGDGEGNGLQWSLLVVAGFVPLLLHSRLSAATRWALRMGAFLALVCLLPTPAYPQYFSICVPFLVVGAVCAAKEFLADLESKPEKQLLAAGCVFLMMVYLGAAAHDLWRYLVTGDAVPGVKAAADKADWRLAREREVSRAIDQVTRPGEVVASFWPGDIFETQADAFPGFENPFGLPIAGKLSAEERAKYHILSLADVDASFAASRSRVVVLRNQVISPFSAEAGKGIWDNGERFRNALIASGYAPIRVIGGITVYECCAQSKGQSKGSNE